MQLAFRVVLLASLIGVTGAIAQSPSRAAITPRQLANGEITLTASEVMGCGSYPEDDGTTLQRNAYVIEVFTRMVNLGCAPPDSWPPPGPNHVQLTEVAGVLPDGLYNVTWTFRFNHGLEFRAVRSFLVINGAPAVAGPIPATGFGALVLLGGMVCAAALLALRSRSVFVRSC